MPVTAPAGANRDAKPEAPQPEEGTSTPRPETPAETAARRKAWGAEWSQISREIKTEHDAKEE